MLHFFSILDIITNIIVISMSHTNINDVIILGSKIEKSQHVREPLKNRKNYKNEKIKKKI